MSAPVLIGGVFVFVCALALQATPGVAHAQSVDELDNCGFETGDFPDWETDSEVLEVAQEASWEINDGTLDPPGPDGPMAPYAGAYSVVTVQEVATIDTLWQDVTLSNNLVSATLSWVHKIRNHNEVFADPEQEFRVEIRDTDDDVLDVIYDTNPGDDLLEDDWSEHTADLSDYIGETIRIAFVVHTELDDFNVHVDNACIEVEEPEPPTILPAPNRTAPSQAGFAAALLGAITTGVENSQQAYGAAAEPVVSPPSTGTGPAITPPSAGDAGLLAQGWRHSMPRW